MININEFPKSKKLLGEFGKRSLLAFQKNIMKEKLEGVEIPEITDEMAESYANALLTTQPRILYDFLDENSVFMCVNKEKDKWKIYRNEILVAQSDDRLEAEGFAFEHGFKQLEEKI